MERRMTRICGAMFLLLFRLPSLAMAMEWNAIIEAWDLTQGIQWFLRGGPIMYQILACSIIARAVFFDRLAFLRRKHLVPERLRGVKRAWQRGEFEVAWGLCEFLQRIISESWGVFGFNLQGTQGRIS
jgi:hypothetical protein